MKTLRFLFVGFILMNLTFSWSLPKANGEDYYTQDDQNKKVLKQAVVGAGTGAIVAKTADGDAGKGALIGAGVNVVGSAALDVLTTSSGPRPQPQPQQVTYIQETPAQVHYDVQERGYAPADADVDVDVEVKRGGCGRN